MQLICFFLNWIQKLASVLTYLALQLGQHSYTQLGYIHFEQHIQDLFGTEIFFPLVKAVYGELSQHACKIG